MREKVSWGTVVFEADSIITETFPQVVQASVVNNSQIDRATQAGLQKIKLNDYSGGMATSAGIGDVRTHLNIAAYNQGLVMRIKNLLYPPYLVTTQSSITSEQDISGFNAANKRVHSLLTSLGDTGLRWLGGLGINLYGDTSSSNPALLVRGAAGSDYVIGAANLRLNSTDYAAFSFKNAADAVGVAGYTNVSGSGSLSGTALVAAPNSGDGQWAMQYMAGLGPTGVNIVTGAVAGVNQLRFALGDATIPATLSAVVEKASKDIEGTLATATTAAQLPTSVWEELPGGIATFDYQTGWGTLTNLGTSDNTYATAAFLNGAPYSYPVRIDFTGQFALAQSAIFKGYTIAIEGHEAAANNDTTYNDVRITVDNTAVGANRASGANFELNATTDTSTTFGSATDPWNLALTGANQATLGIRLVLLGSGGVNNGTASIDTATMAITYRMPGTALKLNLGGWGVTPHPQFPNRFAYVEPAADDPTTITQPRRLCFVDIEWDVAGNRPVGTKTYPNVGGLAYVHHAIPFAGGYAVTGGNTSGPGDRILIVQDNGKPLDLTAQQIPMFMGTTALRCNKLENCNGMLAMEMVNADFSDVQIWFWDVVTGKTFPDTQQQSTTATSIALCPIAWGETTLNLQQNRRYTVFPKTTHTAVRREFIPPNLYADPRVVNETESLTSTTLFIRGMEMEASYAEASASIVRIDYQERDIGAVTNGTAKLEIVTDGDTSFASPEISKEFTTSYSSYSVPSEGVAYQTIIPRISVKPGTGNTTSGPNGFPFLITTAPQWPNVERYKIKLVDWKAPNVWALIDKLNTLQAAKPTQALIAGSLSVVAMYDGEVVPTNMPARGAPPKDDDVVGPVELNFHKVTGQVGA